VSDDDPSRVAIRNVTLLAALLAYALLGGWLVEQTLSNGAQANVNGVQAAAFAALAVALGAGYAYFLGVTPQERDQAAKTRFAAVSRVMQWLTSPAWTRGLLVGGAFLYLAVGIAACVAYCVKDSDTPSVVKTVAIGFGGYVIAYINSAYQKLAG
jgi:hypothetical protein